MSDLDGTVTGDLGNSASGNTNRDGELTVPVSQTKVRNAAYVNGYPDGTFGPEKSMTRAEATAIFARLLAEKNGDTIGATAVTRFEDVPSDAWYAGYVRYLSGYGVVNGTSEKTFEPNKPITRAEVVTIVNRVLEREADTDYLAKNARTTVTFSDINTKHWAYYAVMEAANSHYAILDKGEAWTK